MKKIKEAIQLIDGRARVEVSGTISLDQMDELSKMNIDCVSIGSITHVYLVYLHSVEWLLLIASRD